MAPQGGLEPLHCLPGFLRPGEPLLESWPSVLEYKVPLRVFKSVRENQSRTGQYSYSETRRKTPDRFLRKVKVSGKSLGLRLWDGSVVQTVIGQTVSSSLVDRGRHPRRVRTFAWQLQEVPCRQTSALRGVRAHRHVDHEQFGGLMLSFGFYGVTVLYVYVNLIFKHANKVNWCEGAI